MSPNIHQHTAKIYQFPRRNPAHAGKLGMEAQALADLRHGRVLGVECGSGWYHDRAIDEGRAAPKS